MLNTTDRQYGRKVAFFLVIFTIFTMYLVLPLSSTEEEYGLFKENNVMVADSRVELDSLVYVTNDITDYLIRHIFILPPFVF